MKCNILMQSLSKLHSAPSIASSADVADHLEYALVENAPTKHIALIAAPKYDLYEESGSIRGGYVCIYDRRRDALLLFEFEGARVMVDKVEDLFVHVNPSIDAGLCEMLEWPRAQPEAAESSNSAMDHSNWRLLLRVDPIFNLQLEKNYVQHYAAPE
ncbi:hypothetical protein SCP_0603240 [Sparassis crispa]|uniref:Uncharacterized protein n=1 Tax=Sparassis crispa TaxID=139825 RepID=A0A401GQ49_9APHY|nr:hypothetical protein SCP_0603240 [Sparassis crispa]GBE84346.1 hypothetical protein SCP_0603240 [Sparassis crispa]